MKMKSKFRPVGVAVLALSIAIAIAIASATAFVQLVPPGKAFSKTQATAFAGPLQTQQRFNRLIIKFKDKRKRF